MRTQQQTQTGIVSAPTPETLAAVAAHKRKMAQMAEEREARRQAAVAEAKAREWQAEAAHAATHGRQRDGKFVSRAVREEAKREAEKLSALGFK